MRGEKRGETGDNDVNFDGEPVQAHDSARSHDADGGKRHAKWHEATRARYSRARTEASVSALP